MSPADVLVSVNGRSLTKGEVATKLAKTYQNALRQPGGNANLAGQTVLEERGRIVDAFVGRRLVADAAMRQHLLSRDALSEYVSSNMTFRAKEQNLSLADYETREPRMARYLRAMFEENALIAAFIATNLAPKIAVTPTVVSNYMAEVDAENALVAQTNAALRARLETIRRESLADPNRWEGLAAGASVDDSSPRECEYDDFDSAETAKIVFGTPVGGITAPIEEEEGYRMVRVTAATGAGATNAFGEVSARGTRTCSQIYVEKEPPFLKWSLEETERELRRQIMAQLLKGAVEDLRTNGLNRIDYPHGTNFWRRTRAEQKPPRALDKYTDKEKK